MTEPNDMAFVHVIESPSDFDLLDGRTEGRVLMESLTLSGVLATYNLVTSRPTLDEALGNRLYQAVVQRQRFPIVHFSLHGNVDGIELTDKTFLHWNELRSLLLPINEGTGKLLVVCLSSCYGALGCRMAMQEEQPTPFFALVSHPEKASWSDAAVAFVAFYHQLWRGSGIEAAVQAMKHASGDDRFMVQMGEQVRETFTGYVAHLKKLRYEALLRTLAARRTSTATTSSEQASS